MTHPAGASAPSVEPAGRTSRALVALATALLAGATLLTSQELRYHLRDTSYARALVGGFAREHGLGAVSLLRPVSGPGALMLVTYAASAAALGWAMHHALVPRARSRGRGAELWVALVAAVVLPPLLLATLFWPDGRGMLGSRELTLVTAALALVIAGGGKVLRRRNRGEAVVQHEAGSHGGGGTADPGRGWVWIFAALLIPLVLAVWWNGVGAIRGFDSQSDHLPRAARWLVLRRLTDESGELLTPYYPGNFLVFVRWMLVLGTDAYSFVPSLAASASCVWALHLICREMGQPRWTAMISALSAVSCTLLPFLSTTSQSDVALAACLLVGVVILLRWVKTTDRRRRWTPNRAELSMRLALGASIGLAVGVKYSAIPMAVAITMIVAAYAWRASYESAPGGAALFNARTAVVSLASVTGAAALCCGYWLLRNLVAHGNPVYPVATMGMPGVDVRTIIPIKPSLVDSLWHRLTFPWVQWDFSYVYDDGLGMTFGCIAIVGLLVTPFHRWAMRGSFRLVWVVTVAAFALWIGTGNITVRFGLFPILLTFCFVGELWRRYGSLALRVVTLATFSLSVYMATHSLVVGAVYTTLMPPHDHGVPGIVDSLPAARILNASSASYRYRLLGADYRHEVVTYFRAPSPADVHTSRARYVLLGRAQVPAFTAANRLELVATRAASGGDTLSLWRVGDARVMQPR